MQKNAGHEQIAALNGRFAVTDLGPRLDVEGGPFLDTAALMKGLDLVITCDTAVGHLAGALGVPTWLALSTTPHWLWMTDRNDSPWYPSTRLYRQDEFMRWGPVFARMAADLARLAPPPRVGSLRVEVGAGELIDKITILEIKAGRIADPTKLGHVRVELAALAESRDRTIPDTEELRALTAALRAVNESLWRVEDEIRACERAGTFGPEFVELARSVYRENDRRAELKREINMLLGSAIVEEKSYAAPS